MSPRQIVERVMLAVAKARSNARESEGLEVAAFIDPLLYDDSNPVGLMTVCERVLADGREVSPQDAMNVLILAHRSPQARFAYNLRWHEDLPEPLSPMAGPKVSAGPRP